MKSFALLFPGQGAQYVGMGQSFLLESAESAKLFDDACDILSLPLRQLMFEGPIEKLTATAIAQPAILLHSVLAFNALTKTASATFTCALGHSLGEYSALVAAGVMSFADALRAVHIRGTLMQEAVPIGLGGMAAVIGMDPVAIVNALLEFADEKSASYAICANFNGPLQTVIAGTKKGVLAASQKLKALGARRIVDLPVSAPFHCALMRPAQQKMADVLSSIKFADARFPIISNVSAQAETKGSRIRELLLLQIASPVRFTDCVSDVIKRGLKGDAYLELGPKNTLSCIVKKIDDECTTFNVDALADLAEFTRGLR
jgi:[acyl-carrier-protein] S-malonyltransferase